jgi:cysteine desulfurase
MESLGSIELGKTVIGTVEGRPQGTMQIYLDYCATTPCCPDAIVRMQEVLTTHWGNPSSLHSWGQRAAYQIEQARLDVASLIHAAPETIIFTSGGTEADQLALLGVAYRFETPQHLIISSIEHPAVTETARWLHRQGWEITELPVDGLGCIQPDTLQAALRPETVLVSIIFGQSEVGTVQRIEALGKIAQEAGVLFHTDAVQVAGRMPIDVQQLPIDLLSLSSHKLYGPQGVGALYVRPGVTLQAIGGGGGQERGLRSGTQAVAPIAGFGVAAKLAAENLASENLRLITLRDRLLAQLQDIPWLKLTGDPHHRLPHHLSFCIAKPGQHSITGHWLVKQMNLAGIAISSGSACHSGKRQPSRILKAMGYDNQLAETGIRLSLGTETTVEDVDWSAMVLRQTLQRAIAEPETTPD